MRAIDDGMASAIGPSSCFGTRRRKGASTVRTDLARMKSIALALLAAAALLYALASLLESRHPAWGYVGAFAEAAMVGAIADWFAVVALFRHPLGMPIPHTAIIPSNKDRIGANLATFICANFLSTPQVLEKVKRFDAAGRLADWLGEPRHARQVAGHLTAMLRYGLGALDDERVQHYFRTTVLRYLEQVDVSRLAGQVLEVLTSDRRHQRLLDSALRRLASMLDDETLKAKMAEVIASEVKYLRYLGLDNVAGRYAASKMVSGVIRLAGEMADDPAHPLRVRFDEFIASFANRLKDDPDVRLKGEDIKRELLSHPVLATYLHGLWSDVIGWVQNDLSRADSTIRERMVLAITVLGEKLQADTPMQAWINEQLMLAAPLWIERYREDIRLYIIARVGEWNAAEMTHELERNIGRDLQFIRINGTLVGGLAGLCIHTATHLARVV
jgi:uncharacterized membrane-anchored protein YjiN (DUF445 family)